MCGACVLLVQIYKHDETVVHVVVFLRSADSDERVFENIHVSIENEINYGSCGVNDTGVC